MNTLYYILGATGALFLLVSGVRVAALRWYAGLLDGGGTGWWNGGVRGRYSGRASELGFVSSGYRDRPALLQVSMACAAPIRIDAKRRTLAVLFRKLVGIQPDQKTGVEELDRLFAFSLDARAPTNACFSRLEFRQSLTSLAELGAELVRLGEGLLIVQFPVRFLVPPGTSRMGETLGTMATLCSAAESALSVPGGEAQKSDPYQTDWLMYTRPSGAVLAGPVYFALFAAAIITGMLLLGSFWDFNGKVPWQARHALVNARLPTAAWGIAVTGFAAAFIVPRKAAIFAILLTWPVVLHAVLMWILYLVAHGSTIAEVGQALAEERAFVTSALTTASKAAVVALASGILGILVGARLSWRRPRDTQPAR